MPTVTSSKQFTLNFRDVLKGLIVAVILPVINVIYESIQAGSFEFDWKRIGLLAAGGFIAYIIKNFLTPAEVVVTGVKNDTIDDIKAGDAEVKVMTK